MSSYFIGKVLDNYRILENLGIGGMGVVFKAIHIKLDKLLALKMIAPGLAMDENFINRFQIEAKALAKLEDPNIVRIYDLRSDSDRWFIVMEYVDGITLSDKIKKDGRYEWRQALPILKQILSAIGHAHASGIIHRDMKPNNVMITAEGKVKITDFGLAKDQTSIVNTITVATGGTLFYMSPEHVRGIGFTDNRSDIYSVGMTFYEMVTGHIPMQNLESDFDIRESIIRKDFVRPTKYNKDLPSGLEKIIMKAIAKDPDKRYQTAEDMLKAVEKFESAFEGVLEDPSSSIKGKVLQKFSTRWQLIRKGENRMPVYIAGIFILVTILIFLFNISTNTIIPFADSPGAILEITTMPEDVIVYLENDSIGITPVSRHTVPAGQYHLRLFKDHFMPIDSTFRVNDRDSLHLSFVLREERVAQPDKSVQLLSPMTAEQMPETVEARMATALINSAPAGARVRINGKMFGTTPLTLSNLQPGNKYVRIEKAGYETFSDEFRFEKGQRKHINCDLVLISGRVTINTTPAGGRLFLDGNEISGRMTPVTLDDISVGKHDLQLVKEGYSPIFREINIRKNETLNINDTFLQLLGKLSIQVRPWGSIYLNDELKKSSTDIKYEVEIPVAQYRIKVVHPTFGRWEKRVSIETDQILELMINFSRKFTISVEATDKEGNPILADIFIDGSDSRAQTPAAISVNTGVHVIDVKKEGYTTKYGVREIVADSDYSGDLSFVMVKVE